ncbi:MAG TPA: nuclear transport factor 2 family protein [Elusimicrobiota bacterium]|nr:nuclear transport factor 2 family protein [Elusimicrobiota bacterium]
MFKTEEEHAEIEAVVKDYFQGYLSAEADRVGRAFHHDARLMAADEGKLDRTDVPDWLESLRTRREKGDIREAVAEIAGIDRTGDAAVAKTVLRFPKFQFTDYLSLLKLDGAWIIVDKIYTARSS